MAHRNVEVSKTSRTCITSSSLEKSTCSSKRKVNEITTIVWNGRDRSRRCKSSHDDSSQFEPSREARKRPSRFTNDTNNNRYQTNNLVKRSRHSTNEDLKPHHALVTSPSGSSSSTGSFDESSKCKIEFLETYVATLKSQISYKDKKLHRLQRQSPKFGEDNKDAVLQTAWDQHHEMYNKFRILETNEKKLSDEKETFDSVVRELQIKIENCDKEREEYVRTIANLQNEVSEMQLFKSENETLKRHYEMEVQKKLKDYQKQCFDYVTSSIRAYQVKLRTLQMLWQSHVTMGRPMEFGLLTSGPGLCCQGNAVPSVMGESSTPPPPTVLYP